MSSDPLSRPLIEIAQDLRDRRVTARELVEIAIARHERVGERLHAYFVLGAGTGPRGGTGGGHGLCRGGVGRSSAGPASVDQRPVRSRGIPVLRGLKLAAAR